MIEFYSVVFTNSLGMEKEYFVIGSEEQVNEWSINESSSYGWSYDIKYLTTDNLTGTIKNLCNFTK